MKNNKILYAIISQQIDWYENNNTPSEKDLPTIVYYYLYKETSTPFKNKQNWIEYKFNNLPKWMVSNVTKKMCAEGTNVYLKNCIPWLEGVITSWVEKAHQDLKSQNTSIETTTIEENNPISINKFEDTWIDKLYNKYCQYKGRVFIDLTKTDFDKIYKDEK